MQEENVSSNRGSTSLSPHGRDWTSGSIVKNLVSLSWPIMVGNTLNVIGPTIDMIWVGKLGPDDIAAIGVAGMVVMLVNAFLMGIFTGLRSMVSRYIGARDKPGAVNVSQQAFVVAGILGVLLAIIGISLDRWMLGLLGLSPDVIDLGAAYLKINFIGMIAMSLRFLCDGMMQASGDAITPMKISVAFRGFHMLLSPFLIFGWWIFPQFGIVGAAITGVFSQSLGTLLGLWILTSGRSRMRLTFRGFHFDFVTIWRLIKIGIPASVMGLQMQFGQLVLTAVVVPFGTIAVAAHSLCQRIDMTLSMPLMGLGIASGVLVGQNLGAHKPQRAEKSGWTALGLSEAVLVLIALAIFIRPGIAISLFSSDPALNAVADTYIRIAAAGYCVASFNMVLQQCVVGAGDTIPPMIIGIVIVWVIQIPLAILLAHTDLGVFGVRWGIVAGSVTSMIAYTVYFKMGRWKRKRVY
jgi:putative MATE family efflux protein